MLLSEAGALKLYIASRTIHASRWRALRKKGVPFISTWIDEAGPGQTEDWSELTQRCIDEVTGADITIVYAEVEDVLKGALIEWGAALAVGKPVIYVGPPHRWATHPLVVVAATMEDALAACGQLAVVRLSLGGAVVPQERVGKAVASLLIPQEALRGKKEG